MLEEKIKIGEYVRTKNGYILKNTIKEHKHIIDKIINQNEKYKYEFDNIVKHSKDIINLIEEGDYINEMKVEQFDDEEGNVYLGYPIYDDALMDCIEEVKPLKDVIIESIVTHERFEQMEYRLGNNL